MNGEARPNFAPPARGGNSTSLGRLPPAPSEKPNFIPPARGKVVEQPQDSPVTVRQVPFQDLLCQFRSEEAQFLKRQGKHGVEFQQALKGMARHVEEMEHRTKAAEDAISALQERLAREAEARCGAERSLAKAKRRSEELELSSLEFQAERQSWLWHEASIAKTGEDKLAQPARDDQIRKLEALLQEAIVRGAKLGRSRADAESARADAERRLTKLKEVVRAKVRRERRRVEIAEDRLAEYLEINCDGADALVEAHMRHLLQVGRDLARKVEEQAEIIEVLRGLLQDHKDFIREQLGGALAQPGIAERGSVISSDNDHPWPSSRATSFSVAPPVAGEEAGQLWRRDGDSGLGDCSDDEPSVGLSSF